MNTSELIIPLSTILSGVLVFLGIYVLSPLAIILRDFLILYILKKFIINQSYYMKVDALNLDKANLDLIYNKSSSYYNDRYEIDFKEVSELEYKKYIDQYNFHKRRFSSIHNELIFKLNLLGRICKYFKILYISDYKLQIKSIVI